MDFTNSLPCIRCCLLIPKADVANRWQNLADIDKNENIHQAWEVYSVIDKTTYWA